MPYLNSRWYQSELLKDTDAQLVNRARSILSVEFFDGDYDTYLPLVLVVEEITRRGLTAEYEAARAELRRERDEWNRRQPFDVGVSCDAPGQPGK